jgi:VIT1/CCC1 family predicted Fe2+/Mn2+ transporter
MAPRTDLWLQNLQDERDGAALYEGLARLEKNVDRAASFAELAHGERRHAEVWQRKLAAAGIPVPPDRPSSRIRTLLWIAGRLGTDAVIPYIVANEAGDADKYAKQGGADATPMAEEERAHQQVLSGLGGKRPLEARAAIATRENWHRGGRGGSLRAAIFGVNDGLLSNLSLVLGVAGSGAESHTLVVTGFAGLLAGAFSMAVGEFTSVASQRDILARQVELERRELAEAPQEETAELALIFQQKGLSADHAARIAAELLKNPEHALDTLVREELGLDPEDLGSPLGAALSSFGMFAVGAIVPLLPFLATSGTPAVATSSLLAGAVLAGVGGFVGFLSGTSVVRSGARMLGLAALAAGITYAVGRLFGAVVS